MLQLYYGRRPNREQSRLLQAAVAASDVTGAAASVAQKQRFYSSRHRLPICLSVRLFFCLQIKWSGDTTIDINCIGSGLNRHDVIKGCQNDGVHERTSQQ